MSEEHFINDPTPETPDLDWQEIVGHLLSETIGIEQVLGNTGYLDTHPGLVMRLKGLRSYCESILSILP